MLRMKLAACGVVVLMALLSQWADDGPTSRMATAESYHQFYIELQNIAGHCSASSLDSTFLPVFRYLQVPEIATTAGIQTANDAMRLPPRQFVLYTQRIREIIASDSFSALARTRQLGFTHLVYPGAQGTRLEHSIGVYDLACRIVAKLATQPAFRQVCSDARDVELFLIAALVHDIGHFPYAHQLEEFSQHDLDHDTWEKMCDLVMGHRGRGPQRLARLLDECGGRTRASFALTENDVNVANAMLSAPR